MPSDAWGWFGFAASLAFGLIVTIAGAAAVIEDHRHAKRMRALRKANVNPLDWASVYDKIRDKPSPNQGPGQEP